MQDKILSGLRYSVTVFIPALITFIGTVGLIMDFKETTLIMTLLGALSMFIGTLIGIYPPEDHHGKIHYREDSTIDIKNGSETVREDSTIDIVEDRVERTRRKRNKVD